MWGIFVFILRNWGWKGFYGDGRCEMCVVIILGGKEGVFVLNRVDVRGIS